MTSPRHPDTAPASKVVAGIVVLSLWNALVLSTSLWVALSLAGWGQAGPLALVGYLALLIGGGAVILRVATGRQRVLAAIVSGISGPAILLGMIVAGAWATLFQYPVPAALVTGTLAALIGGSLLRSGAIRAAGVTALVAAFALVLSPAVIARQERHNANEARVQADKQAELDRIVDDGIRPVVTDATGMTRLQVVSNGQDSFVLTVTADGHLLDIETRMQWVDPVPDTDVCVGMDPVFSALDEAARADQYSDFCETVEPGTWRRIDGTGITVKTDGALVVLSIPTAEFADAWGYPQGTTTELAEAAAHLRPLTRDELLYYMEHPLVNPDGQPQHPTG